MESRRILSHVEMIEDLVALLTTFFGRDNAKQLLGREMNYLEIKFEDVKIEEDRERLIKGLMMHVFHPVFSQKKCIMIKSRLYTVLNVKPDFFV